MLTDQNRSVGKSVILNYKVIVALIFDCFRVNDRRNVNEKCGIFKDGTHSHEGSVPAEESSECMLQTLMDMCPIYSAMKRWCANFQCGDFQMICITIWKSFNKCGLLIFGRSSNLG